MTHTKNSYETGSDIVALSTPYAHSALCVIRASGDNVRQKIAPYFSAHERLLHSEGGEFFYGKLYNSKREKVIDEIILLYAKNPKSFTGEDVIEIMAHGSIPGIEAILTLCLDIGMRQALPGEFTFRSFVNGKIDLTQAEAIHEIVVSGNTQSHLMAVNRLSGSVEKEISELKDILINFMAQLNLQLDYAEDDAEHDQSLPLDKLDEVLMRLEQLNNTYEMSQLYKKGFQTVLVGKTNAGKSSLFNLILKQDRSIISDYHGTTRDYVEGEFLLEGNSFHLFDTAGLREAEEWVEKEGIRRSYELLESSQIVLYLQEGSLTLEPEDKLFIKDIQDKGKELLFLINKTDVLPSSQKLFWEKELSEMGVSFLFISTFTLEGIQSLKEKLLLSIKKMVPPATESLYIESKRQADLIKEAYKSLYEAKEAVLANLPFDLLALDCERALRALGEITGEVTREDILERMFSSFCVGK